MAKKLNQQDLLKLTSIGTPPTDSVAFAAKSDGLYQKVGTTESKLSTTAELLDRVKTPVPANAKFTDTNTVYTHPSTPGNKHIPSGGAAGQFLKWSASGEAVWAADNDTKYTAGTNIQISGTNVISATNTNTTYSAGSGLTLSGTQFSLPVTVTGDGTFVKSVTQGADGVSVTLGTPPNTNTTYSTGTLVQLKAGTDTTGRLQTAKLLNEWLTEKGYITSYVDTKYTAGTNIQISGTNVISATNTTYVVATTSANGLMSSGDKTKLDGIATGANKTTLSTSIASTSATTAATSSAVKSAYDRGSLGVTNAATAQARADSAYSLASGKEGKFTKNDAFNKDFGTAAGTVAQGNDSRINNGQTAYGWGNHASAGYIKSYVNTKYTALAGGGLTLSTGNAFSVNFGTTLGTACQGNDSRLSNARPPTTHTHAWSQITSRPTKLSEFTFDLTSWSGNLTITGTLTANALFKSSDVRLKELIQPINTSNIDNIDLIEFNWKSDNKKDYGVIAQDLEEYYPELVNTDDTGIKSVNYESLYAIKIARLEERIKELEDKLCQKN